MLESRGWLNGPVYHDTCHQATARRSTLCRWTCSLHDQEDRPHHIHQARPLRASWDDHPPANVWIDDLTRILFPGTSLSLLYPPNKDDEGISYYQEGHSVMHHPFFRTITSSCTLNNLTSLNYEGQILPIKLLEHTPNIRDISLHGPKSVHGSRRHRQSLTRTAPYSGNIAS